MELKIVAKKRQTKKKSEVKQLRRDDFIPAVLYGTGIENSNLALFYRDFIREYKKAFGKIAFYDIQLDGKSYHTILKDLQIDPVSRKITHIDFQLINENEKMNFEIPLSFEGTPIGTKEGGIFQVIRKKLEITCLPKNVPEVFKIDVSALELNDSIHISDIELGDFEANVDEDITLATVKAPVVEETETEEEDELLGEGAEAATPEESAEESGASEE